MKNKTSCSCIKKLISWISSWYLFKKECKNNLTENKLFKDEGIILGFLYCISENHWKIYLTDTEKEETIKKIKKLWYEIIKQLNLNRIYLGGWNYIIVWLNEKYGLIDIGSDNILNKLKEKVIFDEINIWNIEQTTDWLFYIAEKNGKEWILKCWKEYKWKIKLIFDNVWWLTDTEKWLFYVAKKNGKQWVLKCWKEYRLELGNFIYWNKWTKKIIFDKVWKTTETTDWQYYIAEKNWKQWVLKYWKEYRWKEKIIFDDVYYIWSYMISRDLGNYGKIKEIQYRNKWGYYIAEKNWKQWILKCWEEYKRKEKIIFNDIKELHKKLIPNLPKINLEKAKIYLEKAKRDLEFLYKMSEEKL